jgi:hypothetical protein
MTKIMAARRSSHVPTATRGRVLILVSMVGEGVKTMVERSVGGTRKRLKIGVPGPTRHAQHAGTPDQIIGTAAKSVYKRSPALNRRAP